jgi:hypothetical protein
MHWDDGDPRWWHRLSMRDCFGSGVRRRPGQRSGIRQAVLLALVEAEIMNRRGKLGYLLLAFAFAELYIISTFIIVYDSRLTRIHGAIIAAIAAVILNLAGAYSLMRYLRSIDKNDG